MNGTYDPIKRAETLEKYAVKGDSRAYYRFRPAKWYGGIVTGDVTVCNLLCAFCWAGDEIRHHPQKVGKFYSPEQAFKRLCTIGDKKGYRLMRLSGQEPTIGREHLLRLLRLVDKTKYRFILETNGILIGHEKDYAESLSEFSKVHVRVSLKGTNEEEFSALTLAKPECFSLQLKGLENLVSAGVSCHPSAMVSFSPSENIRKLQERLAAIAPFLKSEMEIEELILYPHVTKRLKKIKMGYNIGHDPGCVPKELI
ncbi:MAG: radical SAM protein [Methanomassiliicoccales archaeon]|nr:MAG: radical SAM protein [Methanomassiliicoccales archaeon]